MEEFVQLLAEGTVWRADHHGRTLICAGKRGKMELRMEPDKAEEAARSVLDSMPLISSTMPDEDAAMVEATLHDLKAKAEESRRHK